MKRTTLFLLLAFMCSLINFAQDGTGPTVYYPVYFDVSPPLRDMVANFKPTDNTWKEGYVKNFFDIFKPSNNDLKVSDQSIQNSFGSYQVDTTIQNFDGLSGNAYVPPDTYGDVGPNHYFQVVNCSYAIYNKNGVKLMGPVNNSSIFNGLPNNSNDGDAVVMYDEQANRWLFSQFSLPNYPNGPFFEMIAISQTPDPTGSWYRYQYSYSNMPDYPKYAVWPDGYYMSGHSFNTSGTYVGLVASCFNRALMLTGAPAATMVQFTKPSSSAGFGWMPSDCDGTFPPAGEPCYYVYRTPPSTLGMYAFHVDWTTTSNSTFTQLSNLPVTGFNVNISGIPQPGTTRKLDPIMDRMMYRVQYRHFNGYGSIVCNHTVNASGVAGIRWYELRNPGSGWSVYQQSTYSPDASYRFMGSIAQDSSGNIALGFSISSSTMYPSIHYTGRLVTDPLNTMTVAEQSIWNGTGSQTGSWGGRSRWGDYSSMTVDPDQSFWYTQEYYQTTTGQIAWKTRIGSFSLGNAFLITGSANPSTICSGDSTQLDITASGGSGVYTYSWTSIPPGFTSNIHNPWAKPTVNTLYIASVFDGTNTRTDTVPVTVAQPPLFTAGNDMVLCDTTTHVYLQGSASNYKHISWSTLGDGTFSNDTIAAPVYFPGNSDKTIRHWTCVMTVYPVNYPYGPCTAIERDSVYIAYDWCNGIDEQNANNFRLRVVPNPAHDNVMLTVSGLNNSRVDITVSDIQGKTLFSDNLTGTTVSRKIDVSGYPKGIYFVRAKSNDNLKVEKLVIQ